MKRQLGLLGGARGGPAHVGVVHGALFGQLALDGLVQPGAGGLVGGSLSRHHFLEHAAVLVAAQVRPARAGQTLTPVRGGNRSVG